ncbi:MAG: bifunctional 5,10-methylene-tetrahydrofolate dehydrogenase/5,10-methylene-tetrahydrofolate cyclohydrolase [Elusimicrobia bacterium]|nr:bifunctional 5,10-methylene-tetrahydrofolate dehydrogenase/5,10-methylene-tetrahydrofolate cyclohydrolase [Elusimicrobiota bacterium]
MSARIIDGKAIASALKVEIKQEVENLKSSGIVPGLATLLVGENPASHIYVKSKHRACQEVGISSFDHVLPFDSKLEDVIGTVNQLNSDRNVHAILVQLPLPPQIDVDSVLNAISPEKDVDGFHPANLGRLFAAKDLSELSNDKRVVPIPCTPQGMLVMLQKCGVTIAGKKAVVVGRSMIVGKPMAALLLACHATVTIAHSKTKDLEGCCRGADILVAAIGKTHRIHSGMVQEGAVVLDVGINRQPDGKITGDVDFDSVKEKAGWITPVPGGVGPMTIVMLLKNTVLLARN